MKHTFSPSPRLPITLAFVLPFVALLGALSACGSSQESSKCVPADDACPGATYCDIDTLTCLPWLDAGVDASWGSMAASSDAGMDLAPACQSHGDCPALAPLCNLATLQCEACQRGAVDACAARDPLTPFCDAPTGGCVGCLDDSACTQAGASICDTTTRTCVACSTAVATACAGRDAMRPVCDVATGQCEACLEHADCKQPNAPLCVGKACVKCGDGLGGSGGCAARSEEAPFCDVESGRCQGCLAHGDCPAMAPVCHDGACGRCDASGVAGNACMARDAALPACDAQSGTCVECASSADCTDAGKPVCVANLCKPCATDTECAARDPEGPGICRDDHLAGRCASAADVIYLSNAQNDCNDTAAAGSKAVPYCSGTLAFKALTEQRSIIVIKGDVYDLTYPGAAMPLPFTVTMISRDGGRLLAQTSVALQIASGKVSLRDLTVGGEATINALGILAGPNASLKMNRCKVQNFGRGGLLVNKADFDVTNSVFINNHGLSIGAAKGNAAVLSVATGKKALFAFNSLIHNFAMGNPAALGCDGAVITAGLLVAPDPTLPAPPEALVAGCGLPLCCRADRGQVATDGALAANAASCIDQELYEVKDANGEALPLARLDFQQQTRPQGEKAECGADELTP